MSPSNSNIGIATCCVNSYIRIIKNNMDGKDKKLLFFINTKNKSRRLVF
jgi:hypothetical protein